MKRLKIILSHVRKHNFNKMLFYVKGRTFLCHVDCIVNIVDPSETFRIFLEIPGHSAGLFFGLMFGMRL